MKSETMGLQNRFLPRSDRGVTERADSDAISYFGFWVETFLWCFK